MNTLSGNVRMYGYQDEDPHALYISGQVRTVPMPELH